MIEIFWVYRMDWMCLFWFGCLDIYKPVRTLTEKYDRLKSIHKVNAM